MYKYFEAVGYLLRWFGTKHILISVICESQYYVNFDQLHIMYIMIIWMFLLLSKSKRDI